MSISPINLTQTPAVLPSQGGSTSTTPSVSVDTSSLNNVAAKSAQAVMAALAEQKDQSAKTATGPASGSILEQPDLAQPTPRGLSSAANNSLLLMKIKALSNESQTEQIKLNAQLLVQQKQAQQSQAEGLNQQALNAIQYSEQANLALQTHGGPLASAEAAAALASSALSHANPDDPNFENLTTDAEFANLNLNLSRAYQNLSAAESNPDLNSQDAKLKAAADLQLTTARGQYDDVAVQISIFSSRQLQISDDLIAKLNALIGQPPIVTAEKQRSARAALIEILARITKLMAKSGKEKLEREQEFNRQMQISRQAQLDKAADDNAKQVQKAQHLNHILGCLGKVLGAILTVIGAIVSVATAVTGVGIAVGLALAAVGMALLIADTVRESQGLTPITSLIMDPIVKNIIQPLINKLVDLLKGLGLSETAASALATTMVAIGMIVIIVAAAVVLKGAASSLATKLGEKFGVDTAKNVAQRLMQFLFKTFESFADRSSALVQKAFDVVNMTGKGMQFAAAGAKSTNEIYQGYTQFFSKKKIAEMKLTSDALKIIEQMFATAFDEYSKANEVIRKMSQGVSSTIQSLQTLEVKINQGIAAV